MKFDHIETPLGYGDLICETLDTGRTYLTPQGKKYPSITTVLGILSQSDIQAWRQRVGAEEANKVGRRAAHRGTAVHALADKLVSNEEIDYKKLMPNVLVSFQSIRPIIEKRVNNIRLREKPLYSDHLQVAGRTDLIAEFDNELAVIDIKTSNKVKSEEDIHSYFMQEAAYAIMFEERTGIPVAKLVTIMAIDFAEPKVFIQRRDKWVKPLRETIKEYYRRRMFGHV
jgi:CRISPR/Cas system-associated exonuclease Cas4 (RecB family)